MLLGALLAFTSALTYGVSDFYGAVAARRLGLVHGTALGYLAATATAGVGLLLVGGAWSWPAVGWSAAAAVATMTGVLGFYRAMTVGPASLVSPLIGVLEAAVPVAASTLIGVRFEWPVWVAIGGAVVGATLMSATPNARGDRLTARTGLLSVASGLSLGLSVVLLDLAPAGAGLVPAFIDMAGGLVLVTGLAVAQWRAAWTAMTSWRSHAAPATSGVLLGAANVLLVIALQHGDLAVVGVLISLYPLSTILLARLVDDEKPSILQWCGIAAALVASVLFGIG